MSFDEDGHLERGKTPTVMNPNDELPDRPLVTHVIALDVDPDAGTLRAKRLVEGEDARLPVAGGSRAPVRIAGHEASGPESAALIAARDGLGPVVAVYVTARTGDERGRISASELRRLHRATSDWLAVYAGCHGIDADPDVTVREAAELLVDTHDITDVAALLTGVHRR